MRIFITIVLILFTFSVNADSFDEDLQVLYEITGVKNNYANLNNEVIYQMQVGFFQAADQNIDSASLTEEQRTQVGEILKTHFGDMVKSYQAFIAEKMPYEQVEREIYMPLYKETYTHDEIKELISFYSSPVGKKTVEFSQKINEQAARKSAEKYDSIISDHVNSQINENITSVKKEIAEKEIE